MKHVFVFALLLIFATGCATNVGYVGEYHGRTHHMDVYTDRGDIGTPYRVIGIERVHSNMYKTRGNMQKDLIRRAKAKGANALIITELERPVNGDRTFEATLIRYGAKKKFSDVEI